MVIMISNLKKPGVDYDSTKLSQLGDMVSRRVRSDTNGGFTTKSRIGARSLTITLFRINESGKMVSTMKDEQTRLAGRISSFLSGNGISADVRVQ
ncbi:hypothetical protein CMI37_09405 [Candidatus Pacearchaeota archaeon]|nr:hypothetical protein [Candidatus Pacearchaeota archaeon]|tara:strand:+ start:42 stop:326 length:285 start_codon:yes stop_codon:yes gene_type:complete